jgi:hypothetical protein
MGLAVYGRRFNLRQLGAVIQLHQAADAGVGFDFDFDLQNSHWSWALSG